MSLLFFSCSQVSDEVTIVKDKDIRIEEIEIDSVEIVVDNLSGAGFSGVYRDSLFFFDEYYSFLYTIDSDGHVGNRQLGMGMGPGELPIRSPLGVTSDSKDNGRLAILGGSYDFYLYNGEKVIPKAMTPDVGSVSYESSSAYTLWDETVLRLSGEHLFYNVIGNSMETSLMDKPDYPQKAYILMRVDRVNGKMKPVGHFSETYVKNWNELKLLPKCYYDMDNQGNLSLTFQADSLLYSMDSDLNVKFAFGFQGRDMDTSYYPVGSDMAEIQDSYQRNLNEKGYYCWVKNAGRYTFRSYKKSEGKYGLQIYEGTTLIGDVETPMCLKVAGYVAPYFVSEIMCDEDTNTLNFYRFRINE